MAAFTLRTFWALAFVFLAPPALAGDVSVKLDAGAGFSVKNSTGGTERLRVDEATGNISRNGALFVHTTGTNNTFVGINSGNSSVTGGNNSAFGNGALASNQFGSNNSAFGLYALNSNFNGFRNAAVGSHALRSNTAGYSNSAVGSYALRSNTYGTRNSALGTGALSANTSGFRNTAVGSYALLSNTLGFRNVAVGYLAGQRQTTGIDNIYIANDGVAGESGQIKIGTSGTHSAAFVAGIRGVTTGVADAVPVVIDSAGQLGTVSSSRTVKKEIRDMGDATARLLELRPVTFRYREQQQTLPGGSAAPPEYGLIAEEVAEVFPDLVVYDEKGQPFTVKYHEMAPMLLNEMKKQQRTIEAQRQEIAALTTRLARVETRVIGAPGEVSR